MDIYLHPADCYTGKITKADKDFAKRYDFKNIKFPIKIKSVHKIEKKRILLTCFFILKTRYNIQSKYKKNDVNKTMLI